MLCMRCLSAPVSAVPILRESETPNKRNAEQIGLPHKGSDERQSMPARQFETSESL